MVELFDLHACSVVADGVTARATGAPTSVGSLEVSSPPVTFDLELGHHLGAGDVDSVQALAAGLATALDRLRLDRNAQEDRVRADLDRSRAGFLTAVTHDLRTPLATIKGASGALLTGPSPMAGQEQRELLAAVYEESARLEGIVTKVLALTRIRAGAVRPEPLAVSLGDLVPAAVDRLGRAARERVIEVDLDPELPDVAVDVELFEHVLCNLVENALVHDPSGRPVTLRGSCRDGRMELAVIDHGPGIAPEDRDRVFEEFVRLRTSTDGAGTGLGLAIVQALANANGGSVRCETTPGGGATFVVELPIASPAADEDHEEDA
jgi:two-component system sensor histidine kinase KdpD